MFDKLGVKILGLVDNMSFFTGDDGKKYKIFGEGGSGNSRLWMATIGPRNYR